MQIQAAIDGVEPLLQRGEIERAIHLQGGHDAEPDRAVNGRIEAVEING